MHSLPAWHERDGRSTRAADPHPGRRRPEQSVPVATAFSASDQPKPAARRPRKGGRSTSWRAISTRPAAASASTTWSGRDTRFASQSARVGAEPSQHGCPFTISIMSWWVTAAVSDMVCALQRTGHRPSRSACPCRRWIVVLSPRLQDLTSSVQIGSFEASPRSTAAGAPGRRTANRSTCSTDKDHQGRRNQVRDVDRPIDAEGRAAQGDRQDEKRDEKNHAAGRCHHRLERRFFADFLVMEVDGASTPEAACGRLGELHGSCRVEQVGMRQLAALSPGARLHQDRKDRFVRVPRLELMHFRRS